jgi:hypothetical protein
MGRCTVVKSATIVKRSWNQEKCILTWPWRHILLACSSSLDDSSPSARHVFVLASSSGLRGHKRTYPTILESADHALFKMVRYALLRPLRPELDAKTKTCLAEGELSSRLDEQAICVPLITQQLATGACVGLVNWDLDLLRYWRDI